jgi:hypothetical protein
MSSGFVRRIDKDLMKKEETLIEKFAQVNQDMSTLNTQNRKEID